MSESDRETEHTGPTIRDKRRIDPETYQVREPQSAAAPGPGAPIDAAAPEVPVDTEEVAQLKTALADRTADLQRLQAEYVNYKRRVDRDRDVARKGGIESVLKDLMSVLDDIRSAREHGELQRRLQGGRRRGRAGHRAVRAGDVRHQG